jgi:hypothetical protein
MSSAHEAHEAHGDSGSSDYEKGRGSPQDLDEEKAVGLDGAEYPETKEQVMGTLGKGRSQSRRSQDNRSLKTVRSHHSRAGGDGYTCLDADADANGHGTSKSKPGAVLEQPYLVTWDGDADPENPRSMTMARRWAIVLICAASSLCVYVATLVSSSMHMHRLTNARTCTSSLYTSTYSQLEPEFGVSRLVCTLGLSLFVAGLGAGPMILSPLSEVRSAAGNCTAAAA